MALSYLACISLHLLSRREFQGSLDTFRMNISTDSGIQIMWDNSNYLITSLQSCLCLSHMFPKQTSPDPAKILLLLSCVCVPRTTGQRASQVAQVNGSYGCNPIPGSEIQFSQLWRKGDNSTICEQSFHAHKKQSMAWFSFLQICKRSEK